MQKKINKIKLGYRKFCQTLSGGINVITHSRAESLILVQSDYRKRKLPLTGSTNGVISMQMWQNIYDNDNTVNRYTILLHHTINQKNNNNKSF